MGSARIRRSALALGAAGVVLACGAGADAQVMVAGFTATNIASPLSSPTALAVAPDGRIFICLQGGAVRVVDASGSLLATPFHTFTNIDTFFERGLLGIALDPDFANNGYVYCYLTRSNLTPRRNRIFRIEASAPGSNVSSGTETFLVELDNLSAGNHNGGGMKFGPDGKLYVGVGENAVPANAQSIANRLGKILRYNSDGSIPGDNPASFPGIGGTTSGGNQAIWAVGLRNPYTIAFQPGTGRFFINDVGQNNWEEIDDGAAGLNYGWPSTEGDFNQGSFPNFTRPFYAYPHSGGMVNGSAIFGGAFYNPTVHPFPASYHGDYFFGDYISDWVKVIDLNTKVVSDFASSVGGIVDVGLDVEGRVLMLRRDSGGALFRVTYVGLLGPTIVDQPDDVTIDEGDAAFTVLAAGNQPMAFLWERDGMTVSNGAGGASPGGGTVSGASGPTLTITGAEVSDSGDYTVTIVNAGGMATSNVAVLDVNSTCVADYTGNGVVNTDDFVAYLGGYGMGDAQADVHHSANATCGQGGDGNINTDDFVCYLTLYGAGCP